MENDAVLEIRLPQFVLDALKKEADSMLLKNSAVARIAIVDYLRQRGRLPLDDEGAARPVIRERAAARAAARRAK